MIQNQNKTLTVEHFLSHICVKNGSKEVKYFSPLCVETWPLLFCQLVFTKKRKVETSALCEDFVERAARPQELVNADLLEVSRPPPGRRSATLVSKAPFFFPLPQELSNIHELYEDMKSAVTPQAECSMSLIRKDLASQLRSSVMDFHNWQQTKVRRRTLQLLTLTCLTSSLMHSLQREFRVFLHVWNKAFKFK